MTELSELKEMVASLQLENARIKKTSKQRFDQNKELKGKACDLEVALSRFESIRRFLVKNDFVLRVEGGRERVDYSVFDALRGLMAISKPKSAVSAGGIYAVKIGGMYRLAEIRQGVCWAVKFLDDYEKEWDGVHKHDISEFVLLDHRAP